MSSLYPALFGLIALSLTLFPDEHPRCHNLVFSPFRGREGMDVQTLAHRTPDEIPTSDQEWLVNFVAERMFAGHMCYLQLYVLRPCLYVPCVFTLLVVRALDVFVFQVC